MVAICWKTRSNSSHITCYKKCLFSEIVECSSVYNLYWCTAKKTFSLTFFFYTALNRLNLDPDTVYITWCTSTCEPNGFLTFSTYIYLKNLKYIDLSKLPNHIMKRYKKSIGTFLGLFRLLDLMEKAERCSDWLKVSVRGKSLQFSKEIKI